MSIIWTTLAILLVVTVIVVHEAAHALALRRLGFPIVEAGLGLPLPPRIVLPPTRRVPFRLSLSPWLVCAYVEPDPTRRREISALPYRDRAWFFGAGVTANLVLGAVLLSLVHVLDGQWTKAVIDTVVAGVLWSARRPFVSYVLPALGVPVLILVGYLLATSVGQPQGVAGLGSVVASPDVTHAVVAGAAMSIGLGVLNMLPVFPFDGGRITDAVISRFWGSRAAGVFRGVTGALAGCLLVYTVAADLVWLTH